MVYKLTNQYVYFSVTTFSSSFHLRQAIIPKSPDADTDASTALTEVWGKVVQTFAGGDAISVELGMDWDKFQKNVRKSLGRFAYEHIIRWVGSCEQPKRKADIALQAQGLKMARHI
jgi:hypothetical protein